MRTTLSTEVRVERVAIFAEMAWLERRPELGIICRAARDDGKRMSVATVQSVLPGLANAGARNVIAWCRTLGLCDAQGGLTALGEDVAEREEAPVPEQGVYDLWLAEHPLLGTRILAVERLSSSREQRFEDVMALTIQPDHGMVFRSVIDPQQRFLLRSLPSNNGQIGCLLRATKAYCRLRWTLDFDNGQDQWQLEGGLDGPPPGLRPIKHDPESNSIDLWKLAETWGMGPLSSFGRWQPGERRLAIAFPGLTEDEQDTFRKTLKVRAVDVPGRGTYTDVTLEDVPIGPASAEEAQRWAQSRLDRHLTRNLAYRSRGEVRRLFADLTEGSPLARHNPTLPAHSTLFEGQLHMQKPDLFWSLAAPVDLAPRPVPRDELAPLRIGKANTEPSPEAPGVLRVPYRSGWSMAQLVDRMLGGGRARRVLLCDRYVRGTENLGALKLLVQAVRRNSPSAHIEVWTGDEDPDFKRIQPLTGTPPRSYREAFGRNIPHDRYLLIGPESSEGYGWHLSNSPLHARSSVADPTPDSPLEWRDLTGTRVSADELEPPMRQWLNRGAR